MRRRVELASLAGGLLLAAAGQYRLGGVVSEGAIFYALGVALFAFATIRRRLDVPVISPAAPDQRWTIVATGGVLVGTLFALAVVVLLLERRTDHTIPFALWTASLFIMVATDAPTSPLPSVSSRAERAALVFLLVVAAACRFAWLARVPWTLSGDEAIFGLVAREFLAGRRHDFLGTGWFEHPNLSFLWQGWGLPVLEDPSLAIRVPSAVMGVLAVLGTYLLVRRLFGVALAFGSAFLLATYDFHIQFSRAGLNNVSDTVWLPWALLFLFQGFATRRRGDWIAAGLLGGLACFFYFGARLTPLLLCAVILAAALRDQLRGQGTNVVVFAWAMVVTLAPLGILAWVDSGAFMASLNRYGLFHSGLFERELASGSRGAVEILLHHLQHGTLAYHLYPDRFPSYGSPRPLLDPFGAVLLSLGLGFAIARLADPRFLAMVLWFVAVLVFGGALTDVPPVAHRLVSSSVPAVVLVALAAWAAFGTVGANRRTFAWGGYAATVLVLMVTSLHFYFVTFQASWRSGGGMAETATRLGRYLEERGFRGRVWFFGEPQMFWSFPTLPYLLPEVEGIDVSRPLQGPEDVPPPRGSEVFVLAPWRVGELEHVVEARQGGHAERVRRVGSDEVLLFVAYWPQRKP